jgi:hypothetical protein
MLFNPGSTLTGMRTYNCRLVVIERLCEISNFSDQIQPSKFNIPWPRRRNAIGPAIQKQRLSRTAHISGRCFPTKWFVAVSTLDFSR